MIAIGRDCMEVSVQKENISNYLTDYIYAVHIKKGSVVKTEHGAGCYALTGYQPADYFSDPDLWLRMVYRADRELVTRQASAAVKGGPVPVIEHRILHKSGQVKWVQHRIVVRRNGDRIAGYDGILSDISRAKRAEQNNNELVESELRYKHLLHHLTDYIFTVKVRNGKAVDTFHGPGCLAVTGYTQEDFVIHPDLWISMVYEEDRKAVADQAAKALTGTDAIALEHRIVHRNGAIRWVKSQVVLRKNEQGEVISYDGIINDITDRRKAENLALEQREQLIQADKMATLGTLVAGMAHEINNPNNFISLNAGILIRAWKDVAPILSDYYHEQGDFVLAGMPYSIAYHQISELISGISKGAGRIKKIVDNLKAFVRKDDERYHPVDVNKVVGAAIIFVNNLVQKTTDNFNVSYEKSIPPVYGRFHRLEQVVINLITNACQALTDRSQQLHVSTRYDKQKNTAQILVHDTGQGISSKALKYILDPFYTTKRESGGTGLGLSISYNIIQDHNGELEYRSGSGDGTFFKVVLPVHDGSEGESSG